MVVTEWTRFANLDAELVLVDVIDQFRTIVFLVLELEGDVIRDAQIPLVSHPCLKLVLRSAHTIGFSDAAVNERLYGRQLHLPLGFEHIELSTLLDDDATMCNRGGGSQTKHRRLS